MSQLKNKYKNIKLVELLFYAFPISFIIGNLILSLNLLLFIIAGFVLIKKEQLTFRFNTSYWLLITFFLYFFLSTTIQFQSPGILNEKIQDLPLENNPIFKSIVLLRFLFLIIIVDTLFFNNILNLKKFFFLSFICTSFVSFDVIFQYLMGFDIFGFKSLDTLNSGPFGDELIAGSFLQRFSLFSIFYIFVIFEKKKFNNLLLFFIITIHLTAILLAGNKMPMLLFFLGYFLVFLILKNMRWAIVSSLVFFLIIFAVIYKTNNNYRTVYSGFFNEINFIKIINRINIQKKQTQKFSVSKKNYEEIIVLRGSGHGGIFRSAYRMWKDQPIFGFGLKSFRIKCWEFSPPRTEEYSETEAPQYIKAGAVPIGCSTHPHNYYLELLSESGIIGAGLIIIFFLILLKDSYYYLKKYIKTQNSEMVLLIPVVILFILEIWPIKSTGSFFTTWGATFFWLNTAMLIAAKPKKLP